MDKKFVAQIAGSFIGTAAFMTTLTVATVVTKKIERSRRTKRDNAHKEAVQN